MEKFFIPAVLILGLVLAAILTRWINWFTWGENMQRREVARRRAEARAKARGNKDEEEKDA